MASLISNWEIINFSASGNDTPAGTLLIDAREL